ncbi:membrane protein [Rhodopirellula maiorica SM1]|uniref:Membrane protein n=2 Tax=Novipirellula TaxID=2795426 RepID=M5RUN1_9BACT|nr:membrane protein [Rhodopirellula maiorica SM1]
MTTSWSHFTHGHWWQSVQANVGGFLLAIVACMVVLVSAACFINPRLDVMRYQKSAAITGLAIALITLCDWLVRLYR